MYYEEQIVDGQLYSRTSPNGEWRPMSGNRAALVEAFCKLPPLDQRIMLRTLEKQLKDVA